MNWKEWLDSHPRKRHPTDPIDCGKVIQLPEDVGKQLWEPTDKDRTAAWDLYTELRTRITCQPLHYLSGDETGALESVASLFKMSRELIRKHGNEARHFATLTTMALNRTVRPFTAVWHKKSTAGHLQQEDYRNQFRHELTRLQTEMRNFASVMAYLAEDDKYVPDSESWDDKFTRLAVHQSSIPFNVLFDAAVPSDQQRAIRSYEHNEIRKRHGLEPFIAPNGTAQDLPATEQRIQDVTGLAISGGGLRSATFALGVVQRLAEAGMLKEFDYLSTVSGGGYLGSFLSSYLNSSRPDVGPDANEKSSPGNRQYPFKKPEVGESAALRHLRAHSKFLLTGGWIGRLLMVLQGIYGLLANLTIVVSWVLLALIVFAAADDCRVILKDESLSAFIRNNNVDLWRHFQSHDWVTFLWLQTAFMLFFMPVVLRFCRSGALEYQIVSAIYGALALVGTLVCALPLAFWGTQQFVDQTKGPSEWQWLWLGAVALLQRLGAALRSIESERLRVWVRPVAHVLLAVAGPLFLFGLFVALGSVFLVGRNESIENQSIVALSITTAVLMFYTFAVLDINQSSLHPFYRDRLSEAYLIKPNRFDSPAPNPLDETVHPNRQLLSNLRNLSPKVPYHVINASLNAPAGKNPSLHGRKSDIFTFTSGYSGSTTTGYWDTTEIEKITPDLDLATAMAISGAAASPFMGTKRVPGRMLFAMFNIRLDYWLRIPGRTLVPLIGRRPGPWYLFRQVFGHVTDELSYVNLSDGGHIENLGLYELLRRRCKYIVAIDGECDPEITCAALVNVQRMVRTDFGIEMDFDLSRLKLTDGYVPFHFLLATITYPSETSGAETYTGYLLYLKSSLTGNESPPISRYRAEKPAFSHESTSDLFYDEAQFEAYRSLGHHIASEVLEESFLGTAANPRISDWFKGLREHLQAPDKQ